MSGTQHRQRRYNIAQRAKDLDLELVIHIDSKGVRNADNIGVVKCIAAGDTITVNYQLYTVNCSHRPNRLPGYPLIKPYISSCVNAD